MLYLLIPATILLGLYLVNRGMWTLVRLAAEDEDRERRRFGEAFAREMLAEYRATEKEKLAEYRASKKEMP